MRFLILLLAATSLATAADISGDWSIDGDVQSNPVTLKCSVQHASDGKITGKCTLNGNLSVEIVGEATEDKIQFSFEASGYRLDYSGEVDSKSMKGGIAVAGTTGTFAGKRAAE